MDVKEWFTITSMILSFFLLLINGFMLIYNLISKAKEPTSNLSERITNIEQYNKLKFAEYDGYFNRDLQRIDALEKGTIVTLESLQALLKHSIDGNETDALKAAEKNLSEYLIKRGIQ